MIFSKRRRAHSVLGIKRRDDLTSIQITECAQEGPVSIQQHCLPLCTQHDHRAILKWMRHSLIILIIRSPAHYYLPDEQCARLPPRASCTCTRSVAITLTSAWTEIGATFRWTIPAAKVTSWRKRGTSSSWRLRLALTSSIIITWSRSKRLLFAVVSDNELYLLNSH